jgi:hypothetical protein
VPPAVVFVNFTDCPALIVVQFAVKFVNLRGGVTMTPQGSL